MCLATTMITEKWTQPYANWVLLLANLEYFLKVEYSFIKNYFRHKLKDYSRKL